MSDYRELLDAAIGQLERLHREGYRHAPVSTVAWSQFAGQPASARPAPRAPQAAPTPPSASGPVAGSASFSALKSHLGGAQPSPRPAPAATPAPAAPARTAAKPDGPREYSLAQPAPAPPEQPGAPGRAAAMEELRAKALACVKCPNLAATRRNVVFGVGDIHARLMFVGEAPGMDEDGQGEPFVGRAGQLLTKIIQTMGLDRGTVYIANILKCRPDTPAGESGNRPPTTEEMANCFPFLNRQIDLIQPGVIVALGATAMEGLFGKISGMGITKARGRFREYKGVPVMPTYHPSYLLRNSQLSVKREVWEDMLQVMERLAMPISEKQRAFFLKSA